MDLRRLCLNPESHFYWIEKDGPGKVVTEVRVLSLLSLLKTIPVLPEHTFLLSCPCVPVEAGSHANLLLGDREAEVRWFPKGSQLDSRWGRFS